MAEIRSFADPYSALSRGIESGVGLGLAIKRSNVEEDKLEFLKLQKDLETKRNEDEVKRKENEARGDHLEKLMGHYKDIDDKESWDKAFSEWQGLNKTRFAPGGQWKEFTKDIQIGDKTVTKNPDLAPDVLKGIKGKWETAAEERAKDIPEGLSEIGKQQFISGGVGAVTAFGKEQIPKGAQTVETAKGIMQWNPETSRYDIRVGAGKPTVGEGGPQGFKSERDLRKEYLDITKPFRTVRDSFARVQASAKEPSAAGDLALIFNYMKMLDPASVVRESEFAQAAVTGAWGERMKAAGEKILSGERLSGAMRGDFTKRAKMLMTRQDAQFKQSKGEYTRLAKSYKMDPKRIIVDIEDPLVDEAEALAEGNTIEVKNPETGETEIWDLTTETRIR